MSRTATVNSKSSWIISPLWDMLYIVATPLLIVPVVYYLYQQVFRPDQIALAVMAFATLGHHLPGFMRAFGDQELFARFRWRFLLMPPIIFATALLFTPTPWIKEAWNLSWANLHGLELILFFWASWHGLMQTFGFMRIYDMKRGIFDSRTARLDWLLCIAVFTCGILFSQSRVNAMMKIIWAVGFPTFGPEYLFYIRCIAAGGTLLVILFYLANMLRSTQAEQGITWNKILLIAITGILYWFTGRVTTNLVIGIAMFEIFHAVQYDAIVWYYNRQKEKRVGSRFGKLGFLFRDRWVMLSLYLGMIAAYGTVYFYYDYGIKNPDYYSNITNQNILGYLSVIFISSSFLHYYFDGFIWKVREKKTQENLDINSTSKVSAIYVPGIVHCAKWALFFALALILLWMEVRKASKTDEEQVTRRKEVALALENMTPELPSIQHLKSRKLMKERKYKEALELAQKVAELRPRWDEAHGTLGELYRLNNKLKESEDAYRQAIVITPDNWQWHYGLANTLALVGKEKWEICENEYRRALELSEGASDVRIRLAEILWREKKYSAAIKEYETALENFKSFDGLDPNLTRYELVMVLLDNGEEEKALRLAREFHKTKPYDEFFNLALGMALIKSAEYADAIDPLLYVEKRLPNNPQGILRRAHVLRSLGDAYAATKEPEKAEVAFLEAIKLNKSDVIAMYNVALVYKNKKKYERARYFSKIAYQKGYQPAKKLLEELENKK